MNTGEIITLCASITGVMMAFGKYILPVVMTFFGWEGEVSKLKKQVLTLETNHMAHFQEDLGRIERNMDRGFEDVFDRLGSVEQLTARIDERTKK